jgi:glycosyltransferase involved in cell wall biosynthesis
MALLSVRSLIRRRQPDIVHGHSSIGGVLARAASWDLPVTRLYTPNGISRSRAALMVERRLGRRTHRLIAVSESEGELAVRLGLVPRERLEVILNGIDLAPPAPASSDLRSVIDLAPGTPLVGCLARLVAQKSPTDLVRAAALVAQRHDGVHFLLVGSGPLAASVDEALANSSLGGRFHRLPFLPDAATMLGQLDVFVLPSRFEGLPYSALEAMRAGTPVILTDVVGSRDVIEPGRSGLLVAPGDPVGLSVAILDLLADPGLGAALVDGGYARLRARFDVRAMGQSLAELYRQLLDTGRVDANPC